MQPKIDPSHADVKHSHTIEDHAAGLGGEYEYQEYPKVIGRDENDREIVADSAEHEAMLVAELDDELEDEAQAEAKGAAVEPGADPEPSEDPNKAEAGQ